MSAIKLMIHVIYICNSSTCNISQITIIQW